MQYIVTRSAESDKRGDELVRESPSFPRVKLGETICNARKAAGLTQTQLGDETGLGQSKIARIETAARGTRNIKAADLNAILAAVRIDGEMADELRSYARAPYLERGTYTEPSGSQTWWNGRLRAENLARQTWSFHGAAWDGLAQAEPYMRRLFDLTGESNVAAATKTRRARQDSVYGQQTPGEFQFVVGEAALHMDMGDRNALIEQLEFSLELADRPNVTIRVIPFSAPIPTQVADFSLYQFESPVITDFALVEHPTGAVLADDDVSIRRYQRRWALLSSGAATAHDSRQMIRERLESLRAQEKER